MDVITRPTIMLVIHFSNAPSPPDLTPTQPHEEGLCTDTDIDGAHWTIEYTESKPTATATQRLPVRPGQPKTAAYIGSGWDSKQWRDTTEFVATFARSTSGAFIVKNNPGINTHITL